MIKCGRCGGKTTVKQGQEYHYEECGLDNVYLYNIELRVCKGCGAATPRIPRILELHALLGRAIALQPYPLSGADIRFLRKQLGMKAREWAALLNVNHTHLSQWENGGRPIGSQSDKLIRLLYLRIVEEREGRLVPGPIAESIAAAASERPENPQVYVNAANPGVYQYACAGVR